jgi:hypothetical protein
MSLKRWTVVAHSPRREGRTFPSGAYWTKLGAMVMARRLNTLNTWEYEVQRKDEASLKGNSSDDAPTTLVRDPRRTG